MRGDGKGKGVAAGESRTQKVHCEGDDHTRIDSVQLGRASVPLIGSSSGYSAG